MGFKCQTFYTYIHVMHTHWPTVKLFRLYGIEQRHTQLDRIGSSHVNEYEQSTNEERKLQSRYKQKHFKH